jgi:hypothetical protein
MFISFRSLQIILASILLASCGGSGSSTRTHTFKAEGGKYIIEIETTGRFEITSTLDDPGPGKILWAKDTLIIDGGELIFNGRRYGILTPGDRVHVNTADSLTINERVPPEH